MESGGEGPRNSYDLRLTVLGVMRSSKSKEWANVQFLMHEMSDLCVCMLSAWVQSGRRLFWKSWRHLLSQTNQDLAISE